MQGEYHLQKILSFFADLKFCLSAACCRFVRFDIDYYFHADHELKFL